VTADGPFRSYLYVPGDRPELFDKAATSEADALVLDLEDAVAAGAKSKARAAVVEELDRERPIPRFVRINAVGSKYGADDVQALADRECAGVWLPKASSVEAVRTVASWLDEQGSSARLHLLLEDASAVEQAVDLATSSGRVRSLGLGETDLAADLGVAGDDGLAYARGRAVVAARVARLLPPVQSVFTQLDDEPGLVYSTHLGRRLGFVGRGAIHPSQLPSINAAYTPEDDEVARAEELIGLAGQAEQDGSGTYVTDDGQFIDEAVVRGAERLLALAGRLGRFST
jgi:citrate lyase subunit beta / citryl-CoA lyase